MSTADVAEFKTMKVMLKRTIADLERDWGQAEWTVVYIRPIGVDAQVGAGERMCVSSKRR